MLWSYKNLLPSSKAHFNLFHDEAILSDLGPISKGCQLGNVMIDCNLEPRSNHEKVKAEIFICYIKRPNNTN